MSERETRRIEVLRMSPRSKSNSFQFDSEIRVFFLLLSLGFWIRGEKKKILRSLKWWHGSKRWGAHSEFHSCGLFPWFISPRFGFHSLFLLWFFLSFHFGRVWMDGFLHESWSGLKPWKIQMVVDELFDELPGWWTGECVKKPPYAFEFWILCFCWYWVRISFSLGARLWRMIWLWDFELWILCCHWIWVRISSSLAAQCWRRSENDLVLRCSKKCPVSKLWTLSYDRYWVMSLTLRPSNIGEEMQQKCKWFVYETFKEIPS